MLSRCIFKLGIHGNVYVKGEVQKAMPVSSLRLMKLGKHSKDSKKVFEHYHVQSERQIAPHPSHGSLEKGTMAIGGKNAILQHEPEAFTRSLSWDTFAHHYGPFDRLATVQLLVQPNKDEAK